MNRSSSVLGLAIAFSAVTMASGGGGGQTWNFDITTTGNDVSFVSPTSVDPNADQYEGSYMITVVEIDGLAGPFPLTNVNVTDQIDPALLMGTETVDGPAPTTILNQTIAFPAPPEPPGVSADLFIGLNESGFGTLSATNVMLGTVEISVPPFGTVEVTLTSVRIAGSITVTPIDTGPDADLTGDGHVNAADLALLLGAWGRNPGHAADLNGDGFVNAADLALLLGSWTF